MDFILNSRFLSGFAVGIILYMLWMRKNAAKGPAQ